MNKKIIMTMVFMLISSAFLFANFSIEYKSTPSEITEIKLVDYSAGTSTVTRETIKNLNENKGVFGIQITTNQNSLLNILISSSPFISAENPASKFGYTLKVIRDSNTVSPEKTITVGTTEESYDDGVVTVDPASTGYNYSCTPFTPITCIAMISNSDIVGALTSGIYTSTITVSLGTV